MIGLEFVIIGVGGIGMNIAISLTQQKKILENVIISSIYVVDHDIVEYSNLNRLPMFNYIGQPKTHALYDYVINHIGIETINFIPYYMNGIDFLNKIFKKILNDYGYTKFQPIYIVLDCTDRTKTQKEILEIINDYKNYAPYSKFYIMYMRIGNENNIVDIEINDNYASKITKHQQGYVSTPTNPYYVSGAMYLFYYELHKFLKNCINDGDLTSYFSFNSSSSNTYDLDRYDKLNFNGHYLEE